MTLELDPGTQRSNSFDRKVLRAAAVVPVMAKSNFIKASQMPVEGRKQVAYACLWPPPCRPPDLYVWHAHTRSGTVHQATAA